MNIEIGSEKKFFDFIKNLGEKDKIALISHVDLDGIAAAKIVNEVVDADLIRFLQYDDINDNLAEQLKIDGYNKIIFSDLYVTDELVLKRLEKFAEILILDHHPAVKDWNSAKTTFIKAENGYCATYLCYDLFRRTKDIEQLDWLVVCACIADFCNIKNKEWIESIFDKYGEKKVHFMKKIGFSYEDISKSKFYKLQWELSLAIIYFRENLKEVFDSIGKRFGNLGGLGNCISEVNEEVRETLGRFEREKKGFKDGYVFIFKPKFQISSLVSNIIGPKYSDRNVVIIREKDDSYAVSARRQDGKEDMGIFLRETLSGLENASGGGHRNAAGGHFLKKDLEEFLRRLGVKS